MLVGTSLCVFSRALASSSLLGHWALVSVMEGFCFLKIVGPRLLRLLLLLLLFVLDVYIVVICVSSCSHLVRHIESTEVGRNELSACDLGATLFVGD